MPIDLSSADLSTVIPAHANAFLHIDLAAVRRNLGILREQIGSVECCAVVKADAYGLGIGPVGRVLGRSGVRSFFTAQFEEAVALREVLEEADITGFSIGVLNGLFTGQEEDYLAHGITPVLNDLGQVERWSRFAHQQEMVLPAYVQLESGMNRLGLPPTEIQALQISPDRLNGIVIKAYMSHLACADTPAAPENKSQLERFRNATSALPTAPRCLANSSGIFLGPDYHLDMARPGYALYGGNPTPGEENPMQQVVRPMGRVLQLREIDGGDAVGYGASHYASGPARIATIAVGYADGYLRSLSNRAKVWVNGVDLPVAGRVSMDSVGVDVTTLPEGAIHVGDFVDLIDPLGGVDGLASAAGTIGYELLTALGQRYHRYYSDG